MNFDLLEACHAGPLGFVQFQTTGRDVLEYTTSRNPILTGELRIVELSETGNVNQLVAENRSGRHVFMMDGDLVVGALQNRVLNTSILLPPQSSVIIPVSCVERGRWAEVSACFSSSPDVAPAQIRASKSRHVLRSLRQRRGHLASQMHVWQTVDACHGKAGSVSPTGDLTDAFIKLKQATANERVAPPIHGKADGVAIFHGATLVSLDVFNRRDVFAEYLPRLALSARLETFDASSPSSKETDTLLESTSRLLRLALGQNGPVFPAVGSGCERRFLTSEVVGFELLLGETSVHLSLLNAQSSRDDGHQSRPRPVDPDSSREF